MVAHYLVHDKRARVPVPRRRKRMCVKMESSL
nr:MAG TPA: hypothetical protein [Caudoviricetes sp.]